MNQAKREAEELTRETQKELENMRNRAQSEIQRAQDQARAELRVEAGRMVVRLGEEILGRTITDGDEQKLINEAVEKLSEK
jgi:F0F1-type ATP synthase membrane subunit b/b'